MSRKILNEHRETWMSKAVLREIYTDYYQRIVANCVDGRSLEIGGGSGNLKAFIGGVISSDLVPTEWLDVAADAQGLPFVDGCIANIVGVDVLHHIERPRQFLEEAHRVLKPGGRIILLEPAITPLSWLFYNFFHPEPVDMSFNPLVDQPPDPNRAPFDANQAIPTLLIGRYRQAMRQAFPGLRVVSAKRISLLAYPLSGGFRSWSLVPSSLVKPLLRFERWLEPLVHRLMAFRLLMVIEKV